MIYDSRVDIHTRELKLNTGPLPMKGRLLKVAKAES